MTGKTIGHYRIQEQIGGGAMGNVFRARDERLDRDVAIKLIKPAASENRDHLRRFELEARAAAALSHPNILAVYEFGFDNGTPYIVSELLKGQDLRAVLGRGPLALADAIGYARQIVSGLIAAHDHHIVHRDLKPENVFLTNDGYIKILDFGVAKHQPPMVEERPGEQLTTVTKQGTIIGTYAYMSPEQLRGNEVDHRSDLFSFGAVFYEMLSGRRAFRGETAVDTITAVLKEEPPIADLDQAAIPAGYQGIVKHCLEKTTEKRFQSARDLDFALQTFSPSGPGKPRPEGKSSSAKLFPWAAAAVMAAAVVILGVALWLMPVQDSVQYKRLTFEAGTIYTARFAPDGQSIVYGAAWNGKPVQLFMTVGGSLLPQALQFSDANLLAISRDNELALVLHGMHTAQLETVNGTLARAPLAGTSPHEVLSDVRWADWDAEGKLAAVHSVEGVSRLEYPLGTVLNQSSGWISHIRFSPQGDAIAFLNHPALWDNRGTVCVIDLRGQVQTLTVEWESESGLAWSPNGKEIWFTASDKGTNLSLRAVSRNGKLRTLLDLPVAITLQDIAADGRVLVSLNSKRMSLAYTTLGGSLDSDLSWHDWNPARDISSDGSFVLFEDSSEAAGPNYAVVIRKTDGSPPETLGEGSPAALSPDGKWVLSTFNSKAAEISVLPVGAGQARSIPVSGLDHVHNGWGRYLPDGQRVVVNGDIGGQSASCYVIDLASGKARSVTPVGTICGPVSPDGRFLIGVVTGKSITIYPIDGGKARSLPRPQSNFVAVQWSSDGAFLYGFHPGEFPSRILKFEIATEKETVVQELKPNAPAGVVTVSPVVVSRDGKRFAYSYNQTLSSLFLVSGLR